MLMEYRNAEDIIEMEMSYTISGRGNIRGVIHGDPDLVRFSD